jgi:glycine betaine/choline ABC-type transport system substrate-binding protein
LAQESELRGALSQLSGKISLEAMRKMNAAVETDERKVEDVAAEFLKSAGLN